MFTMCCANQDPAGGATTVVQVKSVEDPPLTIPKYQEESPPPKVQEAPKEAANGAAETAPAGARTGLSLSFKTPDGTEKTFDFTKSPLGMDFYKSLPITLKRVHEGSAAHDLGIEQGWVLIKVDSEDITGKSLQDMHRQLKKVASELPK